MAHTSKKRRFLNANPQCCYCGQPSETIDHKPSRQLFFERHAPELLEFPSCQSCNASTRLDETVLAYYGRLNYEHSNQRIEEQFDVETEKILEGLRNNKPGAVPTLPSTNEMRSTLRRLRLIVPPGQTIAQQPLVRMTPEAKTSISKSLTRLTCALAFRHLGATCPTNAAYWVHIDTNVSQMSRNLFDLIPFTFDHPVAPVSPQQRIGDLFRYIWSVANDGSVFAVAMQFGQAFIGIGAVVLRPSALQEDPQKWTDVHFAPWSRPDPAPP